MSDNNAVPIPERLQARPTYRGLVVPFTTLVSSDGVPDFRTTDTERWMQTATQGLCALCGTKLDYYAWYLGSAAHADEGRYFDLGMHEECARYAVAVCPFIAYGKDYSTRPIVVEPSTTVVVYAPDLVAHRPKDMFLSKRRAAQLKMRIDQGIAHVQVGPELMRERVGA